MLAILCLSAGVAAAQEPPVEVNVDNLPSHVRARVLEKAKQGRTALIQYLNRTYAVHQLRPHFVIVQAGDGRQS